MRATAILIIRLLSLLLFRLGRALLGGPLCRLLGIFLSLLVDLLLNLLPLRLSLGLELGGLRLELWGLGIPSDQALEQLDLVRPDLLVLDRLAVRSLLVDRRLEDHGQALEGLKVHDVVERPQTQAARADVGVQIAVRAKGRLAVVEVEGFQVLEPDDLVKLLHRLGEGLGRPQVITGREGVARVDAHAHPALVLDVADDVAQLLEPGPDHVAAAAHVLDQRDDRLGRLVRPVELRGDPLRRRLHGVAARGARVEVVQPDAEVLAPLEVVDEVVVRLVGFGLVRLREVDEVRAVRQDVLGRLVAVLLQVGVELGLGLGGQWGARPFPLGLEEEGERVGADLDGVCD